MWSSFEARSGLILTIRKEKNRIQPQKKHGDHSDNCAHWPASLRLIPVDSAWVQLILCWSLIYFLNSRPNKNITAYTGDSEWLPVILLNLTHERSFKHSESIFKILLNQAHMILKNISTSHWFWFLGGTFMRRRKFTILLLRVLQQEVRPSVRK